MNVSATVFACYEKACAPPPVGSGGSSGGKHPAVGTKVSVVMQAGPRSTIKRQIKVTHVDEDGTYHGIGKIHGVPMKLSGKPASTHHGVGPNVVRSDGA